MRYADAVASAPPGSERFGAGDLARLSRSSLCLLFEPGPAAPPLEDVAAALGLELGLLVSIANALPPARGERLLRLGQRPVPAAAREAAAGRLVRGCFWTLTYELAPLLWDRLATGEPVAPELLAELPADGARVLEVGAGSGRVTGALARRAACLVAVEPSPPLRALLLERHPGVQVVAGVGQRLPVASGWADLVVCCAAPLGGEAVRAELERAARPGGLVAMVEPESRAWWAERGYVERIHPEPAVELASDLEAFFGPARPPHRVLLKRV